MALLILSENKKRNVKELKLLFKELSKCMRVIKDKKEE